jgi:hypothetical protein
MDAKQRFFDTMEKEMVDAIADSSRSEDHLGLDFSVTESGRTVAHMIGETSSGRNHSPHLSDAHEGDEDDDMELSTNSGHLMGLTEADQEELVKSFVSNNNSDNARSRATTPNDADHPGAPSNHSGRAPLYNTASSARSIPVPAPNKNYHPPLMKQEPQSQPSSHGSSGSAFLSSMLNPSGSAFGHNSINSHQLSMLSHTPPTALGTSYEASHFGKRARSGSISGRLRSASEYLEDKGLIDRETKGILKDLIIIGDEELQEAIDRYEGGDPSLLEEMISSGALQNRLPKDIDILGDLDLDFLTMDDGMDQVGGEGGNLGDIEPLQNGVDDLDSIITSSLTSAQHIPSQREAGIPSRAGLQNVNIKQEDGQPPNMVSPPYDDGIGELEFAGDFVSDQADFMQIPHQAFGSKQTSAAASPAEATLLNEFESRMRSNSLFSALLNDPRGGTTTAGADGQNAQYGQWMDSNTSSPNGAKKKPGININKSNRRASAPVINSGLGASLEQYKGKSEVVITKEEQKRRDKKEKKERKEMEKQERKDKKEQAKKKAAEDEMVVHVPGSGRPRSLSDPNLSATVDQHGLMQVDRPDGWVGAYSPESRTVRIERFMAKRNHRVWTKTVKYDVRKNFADSRLRVKGRFVKKEDELLMRELMSLT